MIYVFFALQFLIAGSINADTSPPKFNAPQETSPSASLQNQVAIEQHVYPSVESSVNSDPSGRLRDPSQIKKREGIRKTIAAIGVSILIPLSLFLGGYGSGAFDKTLDSEERKKRIKWIVLAVLSMGLVSFWNEWATLAVRVFMGEEWRHSVMYLRESKIWLLIGAIRPKRTLNPNMDTSAGRRATGYRETYCSSL